MGNLVLSGATSGSITLEPTAVAGTNTITLPALTGTVLTSASPQSAFPPNIAGNGPAFSAYASVGTSISNVTFTKIAINTEEYDTNSNFNTTNNRFTPTVAGYYQVNGRISFSANLTSVFCVIYKNGSEAFRGTGGVMNSPSVSALVYMNGTTDYVELYAYQNSGSPQTSGTSLSENYFQASLVRAA